MPRWSLTQYKKKVKTESCPLCPARVPIMHDNLRRSHALVIKERGDIFWIRGATEAFYDGRYYRPNAL